MSGVVTAFCSIIQIAGLGAIVETCYHTRSLKYRGWMYLISGFAPLFKMPFSENHLFIEWLAFFCGIMMVFLGTYMLIAANKAEEANTLPIPDEPDEPNHSYTPRIIDLD